MVAEIHAMLDGRFKAQPQKNESSYGTMCSRMDRVKPVEHSI